jgi:hypothetical protein
MSSDSSDGRKLPLIFQLGETTWKVLLAILSLNRPIGPRELSKRLHMSSPSVGLYHLEKLNEHNILEKNTHGEYQVREDVDLGFLENFLFFEQLAIPRFMFYAAFFTGLLVVYSLMTSFDYGIHNVFALIFGIAGFVFFWFEVQKIRGSLGNGKQKE